MKNSIKYSIKWLCLVAALIVMGSCSKWTDPESLEIVTNDLENQNPELNARYLAALRAWKADEHKVMFAYINNVETPFSRACHLTQVPDSVDVVVLQQADMLPEWIIAEKNQIREQKSTLCVYEISYTAIEKAWKVLQEAEAETPAATAEEGEGEVPTPEQTFIDFVGQQVDSLLQIGARYDYDGVIVEFQGKNPASMKEEAKAQYTAELAAFFTPIAAWVSQNPSKGFIFEGSAQNLIDNTLLKECDFLILPSMAAASTESLTFMMAETAVAGVPTDRFIAKVQTVSLDAEDIVTGYYGSERALLKASMWVAAPQAGYTKCGLAVYNLQNDYYNLSLVYQYVRKSISIMNPAPKN